MATVSEILGEKSGDVIRIAGTATVFDAVKAMVAANVGAILVTKVTRSRGSSPSATTCAGSLSRAGARATRW